MFAEIPAKSQPLPVWSWSGLVSNHSTLLCMAWGRKERGPRREGCVEITIYATPFSSSMICASRPEPLRGILAPVTIPYLLALCYILSSCICTEHSVCVIYFVTEGSEQAKFNAIVSPLLTLFIVSDLDNLFSTGLFSSSFLFPLSLFPMPSLPNIAVCDFTWTLAWTRCNSLAVMFLAVAFWVLVAHIPKTTTARQWVE